MGLFSSMPKKPVVSGASGAAGNIGSSSSLHQYDRNSRGKIMPREMSYIQQRLIHSLGHRKAERVMEHLQENMDKDGGWGSKNISSHEVETVMKTLDNSHYDEMDNSDLDTTRKILEGYE